MIHILVIAACACLYLHDAYGAALPQQVPAATLIGVWLAGYLGLAIAVQAVAVWARRRMDRRGSVRAILRAERFAGLSRLVATGWHGFCVVGLGLPVVVRGVLGDWVLLDEAVMLGALLLSYSLGWWSVAPIERRLREARLMHQLDAGQPIYAIPSRLGLVTLHLRSQVLIILLPVLAVMGFGEGMYWLAEHGTAGMQRALANEGWRTLVITSGSLTIFLFAPLLVRIAWSTVRLGEGGLRDHLLAMCRRHRVRVRELLVWQTGGLIPNAAVIGLIAPLRYVILSDALLDRLSAEQVEAVAAHELGHIRRRHMPWLAAGMLGLVLLVGTPAGWAVEATMGIQAIDGWVGTAAAGGTLVLALLGFGHISRRFEWQADAFAVQHLSGLGIEPDARVTPEATTAMVGALTAVAASASMSPEQFSWRHGSIALRCRKLLELTGKPIGGLPIDETVRRMKLAITLGLAAGIAMLAIDFVRAWPSGG